MEVVFISGDGSANSVTTERSAAPGKRGRATWAEQEDPCRNGLMQVRFEHGGMEQEFRQGTFYERGDVVVAQRMGARGEQRPD